ncbi:hypothetical protein OXPF_11510 [Oxobacter pfennigii]|uniref:Transmembrane protein n=1 Tax=Oxobacter pfennigii TaxID=36849 RepID=A0A0P8W9D2_9CLOT|nr:hypothetical protein [Oxobacter pfennigii]KPU45259.1 hypothetical protein OXPF_11510 [Oxobacter pfennigii]
MSKYMKPSIFAVILLILISGYALFCQPLIGLADNGDFFRIIASNGLKHEQNRDVNDFFGYFNYKYDKLQYYNELEGKIKSTHNIILRLSIAIDDIFTNDEKFDIRFQAAICLIVLAFSIYWMVEIAEAMTQNKKLQYFFALMAVVIFGDIGYTSYFNSFYGEAIAYPFFLLSISALLKFILKDGMKIRYILTFFMATFIFIGSKNQLAPNGIIACILLITLLFFRIEINKKILAVAFGFILLVSTLVFYIVIDDSIYLVNKYHMMTRGIMLFEPDVQQVTEESGLNGQYSLMAETIYFDRTPAIDPKDEILIKDFYSQYNIATVTMYYFTHPKAFSKMMELGWKNSFTVRPEVLGNYTRSSGRDFGERTSFFTVWSYFKDNYIPHTSGLIYIIFTIYVALSINRILKYRQKGRRVIDHCFEAVMVYIFLTGFSQILVSFIGAGDADLKKHLFMTTVSLDILFYFNLIYAISIFHKKSSRKEAVYGRKT